MPSPGFARSLVLLLCGAVMALGCSADTEPGGDTSGSLSLGLVLAEGIEINSVDWKISGNDMEMSGTIDTSAPEATASVEVYGLPAGDGYLVELEATSEDGEVSCSGSAEFGVMVNAATGVMVRLRCKVPAGTGAVRVNGKFNICAKLIKAVAAPLQTSVGNDIALTAGASDLDGNAVEYMWTGTGGTIDDPNAPSTTYTCGVPGMHTVTVTVSDEGFQHCMHGWTISVSCIEAGLCDDVDCDDENECTNDECRPSDGTCVNDPVNDGTSCDDGAGSCSSGQCVPNDLCENVDCDDENECTVDVCNPNDGSCSNTPVDDGTSCDDGAGRCIEAICMEIDLCEDVDCTSDNECVQDGTCNPMNGMCIDGDFEPEGTVCRVGGKCDGSGNCVVNTCATIDLVVVSPLQTSIGNVVSLAANASDIDGDAIEYLWTGAGGSIDEPTEVSTFYTCEELGSHMVNVSVSDDGFDGCVDQLMEPVEVTCVSVED